MNQNLKLRHSLLFIVVLTICIFSLLITSIYPIFIKGSVVSAESVDEPVLPSEGSETPSEDPALPSEESAEPLNSDEAEQPAPNPAPETPPANEAGEEDSEVKQPTAGEPETSDLPPEEVVPGEAPDENLPSEDLPIEAKTLEPEEYSGEVLLRGEFEVEFLEELLDLINQKRAEQGLAPLQLNEDLEKLAQYRAVESMLWPDKSQIGVESKGQELIYQAENETAEEVLNTLLEDEDTRNLLFSPEYRELSFAGFRYGEEASSKLRISLLFYPSDWNLLLDEEAKLPEDLLPEDPKTLRLPKEAEDVQITIEDVEGMEGQAWQISAILRNTDGEEIPIDPRSLKNFVQDNASGEILAEDAYEISEEGILTITTPGSYTLGFTTADKIDAEPTIVNIVVEDMSEPTETTLATEEVTEPSEAPTEPSEPSEPTEPSPGEVIEPTDEPGGGMTDEEIEASIMQSIQESVSVSVSIQESEEASISQSVKESEESSIAQSIKESEEASISQSVKESEEASISESVEQSKKAALESEKASISESIKESAEASLRTKESVSQSIKESEELSRKERESVSRSIRNSEIEVSLKESVNASVREAESLKASERASSEQSVRESVEASRREAASIFRSRRREEEASISRSMRDAAVEASLKELVNNSIRVSQSLRESEEASRSRRESIAASVRESVQASAAQSLQESREAASRAEASRQVPSVLQSTWAPYVPPTSVKLPAVVNRTEAKTTSKASESSKRVERSTAPIKTMKAEVPAKEEGDGAIYLLVIAGTLMVVAGALTIYRLIANRRE